MNDIQYTYICHKQISNHESFISKQNKVKLYTVELAHSTKNDTAKHNNAPAHHSPQTSAKKHEKGSAQRAAE